MGKLPEASAPVVSIVGSRKPSAYGKEVTERLATDLAKAGCVIVSGLALGVDCIAQKLLLKPAERSWQLFQTSFLIFHRGPIIN